MTDLTLHHVYEYGGGPLAIKGHIYGEPNIRYLLKEHPDTFGITPSLIAWSYNREEVEALLLQLSGVPSARKALEALPND